MEEQKNNFKLSKVNWIFAIIVIGISSFVFLKKDGINGYSLGYLVGLIVTAGIIPLIFALVVWLIRGRVPYAGTYTFNIVLAILCLGIVKEIGAISMERSNSIDEISKSVSSYKDSLSNNGDPDRAFDQYSSTFQKNLAKLINNSSGNEQEVYKKLLEFFTNNQVVMVEWQKSYDSVMNPRILDYSILNSSEELKYQVNVLEHYKVESESYKRNFITRKSRVKELFKNIPENNELLKGVMTGISKKDSVQKPVFVPLIDTHIEYSKNLISILDLLEKNGQSWTYDNGQLFFESEEIEDKFTSIIQKVIENEKIINELTDKLIEVM